MVSLREKYPLDAKKPLKKTIVKSFWYVIAILFLLFIFSFDLGLPKISSYGLGAILLVVVPIYVYEIFYMKFYFYDLVGKSLVIRKGVFSRSEITLPINRLQDVYVDQDILDRIFGLYDVHVSSATSISGRLSHIDGLNKQNAEPIKKLILYNIHRRK